MTRERQILAAVALLDGRGRKLVEIALATIEEATSDIEWEDRWQPKQAKLALRQLKSALHRARVARDKLPSRLDQEAFGELENYEALCAEWLAMLPSGKPKRSNNKGVVATVAARELLIQLDYPPTVTRKGRWHKLAAILYGNRSADLFRYCRGLKDA